MTRKDYVLIAKAIRDANEEHRAMTGVELAGAAKIATYIADDLKQDNPRFDRVRCMAACGLSD